MSDLIEASTLGLPPGRWPDELTVGGAVYWRTHVETDRDGDVLHVIYVDAGGDVLTVIND